MRGDDAEETIIVRRDDRREQRAKVWARTQDRASESVSIEQFQWTTAAHRQKQPIKWKRVDTEEPGGDTRQEAKDGKFEQKSENRGIGEECLGTALFFQKRTSPLEHSAHMKWWKGSLTVSMRCARGRS